MHVTISRTGPRWVAACRYEDREIPKAAGFRWDAAKRQWFTTDPAVAAKLESPEAATALMAEAAAKQVKRAEAVDLSRAASSDVVLPVPEGLSYLPYQRAGIAAALARPNVLFGDEMGLGKTIQAIGVINADPTIKRILVICPASLRLNWQRELRKWLVIERSIALASGSWCHPTFSDITIINYDILTKHADKLRSCQWDAIIIDEAHFLKNPKAKRTRAVFGIDDYTARKEECKVVEPLRGRRAIALTGTPIPNRPIEGFPVFHYLDENEFRSFFGFAKRYCAAGNSGYGFDCSGSSNLPELQTKLRASIMIRRLKADVLTELPAKRRAVIEIPADGASHAVEAEQEAWGRKESRTDELRVAVELAKASADPQVYADAVANLKEAAMAAFEELSQLRHDTAVAKIPYVVQHVKDLVDSGIKVVVFAHHHDVIDALAKEFGAEAAVVDGRVGMQARQDAVDRFQTDPECMVFLGGIHAAGVGLTLTAASHVVFAELDWVPGNVTQCEDRCHRIGQRDMVTVQHLVLEGSIDARMATILVQKQEVIAAALDTEVEVEPIATPSRERAATESISRAKVEKEAATMTPAQIASVHHALRMLAGMCDGAHTLDGSGFSRIDVGIGHSLANCVSLTPRQAVLGAKLAHKYRRQLGGDVLAGL